MSIKAAAGDVTAPVVSAFTMPATASSLTVNVSSFTATDAVGVTGYMITESATAPLAGAAGWTGTAPATVTASAAGSRTFYPWAKDAAGNVSAVFATPRTVVITLPDVTAPVVSAFTMPATASSLTVNVSSFTATDAVGVTGYMITESATAPLAGAAGWTGTAPATVTASGAGSRTFYPWAKDAAGNVSAVFATPRTVVITLPDVTAPVVSAFTMPATASSVTVNVTTFTATDAVGVTGYMITESATAPLAGAAGWTGTAPATVTAGGTGSRTFYPWAKDAAGNVSAVFATPRTVVITTAPADALTVSGNTTIASGSKNENATYVIMQRFQVNSTANGDGAELSSLTLDDNSATATAYTAARVYISLTSVSTSTLPAGAAQIGKLVGYTGTTAPVQTITLNMGTTDNRTVTNTAPKFIYIVYDMASGQSGRTAMSRVTALTVAGTDTVNAFTAIATTPAVNIVAGGAGGTISSCSGCHGANGAFTDGTARNNPAGTFPGSHNTHAGGSPLSETCDKCHVNPAANNHRNGLINMAATIFSGTGSYTRSGPTYSFAQSNVPNPVMGQCNNVYCHSNVQSSTGGAMVAGDYKTTPVWGGTALGCTGCHGNAPASGSHAVTQHSAAVCTTCHADPATATHVNGQINLVNVGYSGDTTPGNSNFGACSTASCHQTGTAIPSYVTSSNWGVNVANCTTCHAASPTTNNHAAHIAVTNNCSTCHGATAIKDTSYNDALHINTKVDVAIGGYPTNKNYGTAKGACSNTNCHGTASPTWGTSNPTYDVCVKCHGVVGSLDAQVTPADMNRAAPGYTAAAAPVGPGVDTGNSSSNTDAEVGAHDAHLRGTSGISSPIACTECHLNVSTTDVNFTGHMNGAGTIAWGTLATTTGTPNYTAPNCSNVYCHRVNRPAGAGANQGGITTAASWTNPALLGGTNITDTCTNKCHAMPPGAGVVGDTHAGVATVGGTLTATVLQTCSTNGGGTGCHPNINSGSTTTVGALFFDRTQHIDGVVNANGHNFPYSGSLHLSAAGTTPWSSCSSCHNTTAAGTYPVAVGTAPNCEACHVNGLLAPSGTSSCWDCHGASATNAQPNGAAFPNNAGSHAGHNDAAKIALTCSNCHNGLGAGTAAHGNSNRVAKTEATVAFNGLLATPTYAQAGNTCTAACHIAATWGATLGCVDCHAATVTTSAHTRALPGASAVTTRAAAVGEFTNTWSHKRSFAGSPKVTNADCIVCHMEGNKADGNTTSAHANGYINLRDPDTGNNIKNVTFAGTPGVYTEGTTTVEFVQFSRDLGVKLESDPNWLVIAAIQQNHCLKCHDSNVSSPGLAGAANANAQVPTTGTALKPFGTTITHLANTIMNNALGSVYDVKSNFLTTNASYHPVSGKQNNSYADLDTMTAPYNQATKTARVLTAWGDLISCWDCHAAAGASGPQNRTVTAHGGAATLRAPAFAGGATAALNLCLVCHKATLYPLTTRHSSTLSAFSGGASNMSATTMASCHNCHSNYAFVAATNRPIRAEDAHGFNARNPLTADSKHSSGSRPYAFWRTTRINSWSPASATGDTLTETRMCNDNTGTTGTGTCGNNMDTAGNVGVGGVY